MAAGVASLAATGVVAGTYPKVTVDAKGRVTGGTTLVSGDIPAHTHVATDIVSGALPFTIQKAGTAIGTRRALNLIEGANVTILKDPTQLKPSKQMGFRGVTLAHLRRALEQKPTPNLVYYRGHWDNSCPEKRPSLLTQNTPIPPPSMRVSLLSLHLQVPLLGVAPAVQHHDSLFIMDACSSASAADQGFVQEYLSNQKVFLGASYPLLDGDHGSSAILFLRTALLRANTHYLAHSLLEAMRMETSLDGDEIDYEDLYRKSAYALFGDVRTHLALTYDDSTQDNITSITLKVNTTHRLISQS